MGSNAFDWAVVRFIDAHRTEGATSVAQGVMWAGTTTGRTWSDRGRRRCRRHQVPGLAIRGRSRNIAGSGSSGCNTPQVRHRTSSATGGCRTRQHRGLLLPVHTGSRDGRARRRHSDCHTLAHPDNGTRRSSRAPRSGSASRGLHGLPRSALANRRARRLGYRRRHRRGDRPSRLAPGRPSSIPEPTLTQSTRSWNSIPAAPDHVAFRPRKAMWKSDTGVTRDTSYRGWWDFRVVSRPGSRAQISTCRITGLHL